MSREGSAGTSPPEGGGDFIRNIIAAEVAEGKHGGRVHTRFPPEPNGFLHVGHAKAICLDFGVAREFGGVCNLRFDDTNPLKEEDAFVRAIQEDIAWLGFDWNNHLYFASDYYERFYECAVTLIGKKLAYVDDLTAEEIREHRGTLTEPGRDSPHRDRTVEENLDLFARMRNGEFPDGSRVLRARIDMASANINLRDPVLYRILRAHHHRTGDAWCIYPMYDYAHPLSDAIEGITHSLCTLEFEDHRPLYDWVVKETEVEHHPRQIEFAKLNLSYAVLSKRRLRRLVEEGHVEGWDDPRLLTLRGMRRRGYPPEAIRRLCEEVGVAKRDSVVDFAYLEHHVREILNKKARRYMAVLHPLKVVITNYPEGQTEELEAVNNPEDPGAGSRRVPFSRELFIERDDFLLEPVPKFYRLAPGREVRLRYAYFITCEEAILDPDTGEVVELRCTYDPETRSGSAPDGRKVKATLHWVSAAHAPAAEVRLYSTLFSTEDPGSRTGDFLDDLDPDSLQVLTGSRVEPALVGLAPETQVQFERLGYFTVDASSAEDRPVFNRTATLRDTWARIQKGSGPRR
jgi:glutaminyl-tRNA synthetase